ncbi:hypothetical protein Tcan_05734 [Toxocara canis]|uniref:Major sperm protein n=1 Tax=Toxocara canis TaxID=6265 RepID=A0A0B2W3N3_TOXCA|nr:hypothetical protein Tcan_05734 [Toxocara canis]
MSAVHDGSDVDFALDVDSLASVCNSEYVVFRQSGRESDIATAILLVGNPTAQRQICKVKTTCNKMFVIRPAVFDLEAHSELPVKITYIPTTETANKQREEQWFAIHCITPTDNSKTAQQCWAEIGDRADTVKRLRVKFETIQESGTSDNVLLEGNCALPQNVQLGDKTCDTKLRCVPSDAILFKPAEDSSDKRLFTTISFINGTSTRRAVQMFCPLDPLFLQYQTEMFTVDPDMQYSLTMCFLPSKKFREQAKTNKPFIVVAHIDAPDLTKNAEQIWEQYGKKPSTRCIVKKIPIRYDEAQLDALLDGRAIDKMSMVTQNDADERACTADSQAGIFDVATFKTLFHDLTIFQCA